jgi:hypothetical protein
MQRTAALPATACCFPGANCLAEHLPVVFVQASTVNGPCGKKLQERTADRSFKSEVQWQPDTLHAVALAACWLRGIAVDVPSG